MELKRVAFDGVFPQEEQHGPKLAGPKTPDWCKNWGPKRRIGVGCWAQNLGLVQKLGPKTPDWCRAHRVGHIAKNSAGPKTPDWCENWGPKPRIGAKTGAQNLGLVRKLGPETPDWYSVLGEAHLHLDRDTPLFWPSAYGTPIS